MSGTVDTGDDRKALLDLLLAEDGLVVENDQSIPRRDPGAEAVLSFAQERLWFLEQLEAETAALSIRAAQRIRGPLDVEILRRSLDAIFVRHDSLRTHINVVAGVPKPTVLEAATMPFTIDDLRHTTDIDSQLAAAFVEEAQKTFDLTCEFPIAVRLIKLADDDHVISVVMHHAASDGWSFQIFFADLGRLYTAFLRGLPSALPDLPIQYADYAAWQRAWVTGENRDRQLDYWRATLGDSLPTTELPTDFARPHTHTFDSGQFTRTLDAEITSDVRRVATETGTTPFMVLLAAFNLLVGRHVDHDDLVIGTPVAGRVREELEGLIGMFLNTLVLRTDISGDPTFVELVDRVRDVCLGAYDHQDVSFEQLLAELQPPRDLSRTPLFQIFFNMQPAMFDPNASAMPGIISEWVAQPDLGAKFDVTLYVYETDDRLTLLLVYNSSLYRAESMRHFFEQYIQIVGAVVSNPHQPISSYSLVTPEALAILPDPSQPLDTTWHGSVPAAVRRAAASTPEHTAVVDPSVAWSYRSLERNMDRLAGWLVDQGVGKNDLVAIYGHRSASLLCAVTGAMASGAAYLLLDPKYPAARLTTLLRIARPKAWLEVAAAGSPPAELIEVLDELGVDVRRAVPPLDVLDTLAIEESAPDIPSLQAITDDIGPNDFACLTFTSGSTGEPKAIIGLHGSLTHFFPWQTERFNVSASDRFSMLSGLAHDPIQRDMFWSLWVGGTLVVPDPEEITTPGWLADWMRTERVTVTHLTPAMGQLIADGSLTGRHPPQPVESLLKAFFLGDSLIRRDVAQFRALAPNVEIVTFYGATETQRATGYHVVDSASGTLDVQSGMAREVLPLGVGVPDTQLLVRDSAGNPAGIGEIGEIWFRSPHIARGYLHRPDDTADRFFHAEENPTDRYYRTGDRGRYLTNGEVEFFGRRDGQVKVRGFRIELGEVRVAIIDQPHVRDAVVRVRHEAALTQLVAYVVPEGNDLDPLRLRRSLRDRLPAHMLPTHLVVIPRIPLTPNGKLDTAALPSPVESVREIGAVEPRDHLERSLVGWWGEVLGRSDIGIHDDFFDLGGYSLLATRLFALIEANVGRRIPISTLFEAPTIAELASVLRGDDAPVPWSSLVPVQPKGTQTPFFYVAPYMISVLQFAHLGDELGEDQPLYGLQPQGLDGQLPIHERIEDMAAHYIREIRDIQPMGPYRIGGHCSGTWVAFEMARQLEAAGERIDSLVLVDMGPPRADREPIKPMRYILRRLQFYYRDRRIRHAVAWQIRVIFHALLLRRVGTKAVRSTENVRSVHRAAYQEYEGGVINQDIVLIRSEESLLQADKNWYARWDQKTTGGFHHRNTDGTHDNLLEQPYVKLLADRIRWAFQLSHANEDVA